MQLCGSHIPDEKRLWEQANASGKSHLLKDGANSGMLAIGIREAVEEGFVGFNNVPHYPSRGFLPHIPG